MPIPCAPLITLMCPQFGTGKSLTSALSAGFLDEIASYVRNAIRWLYTDSVSYWLKIPSPDLTQEPAIDKMRQWLLPICAAVAVGAMIAAGIRMCLTRRANPLLDIGTGLVTIAAVAALGVTVPNLLLQAGDGWSSWVLQTSTGGDLTARMNTLFSFGGSIPAVFVIIFGILALVMSAIQAALLLFRQAAIVVLAAVLPLAAAGSFAPLTRAWIRKITSWMLALVAYKPAAAAVYGAAFTMIGDGENLQTMLMGFAMLALSLLALPALMRFFTWTTGAMTSGGGGHLLGMGTAGAMALGAMRGSSGGTGDSSAAQHASYLSSRQPPSSSQSTPPGSTPSPNGAPAPGGGNSPGASASNTGNGAKGEHGSGAPGGSGNTSSTGASGSAPAGGGSAGSGSASSAPGSSRTVGASAANAAGVAAAAVAAAQALATGARSAAGKTTEEGDR